MSTVFSKHAIEYDLGSDADVTRCLLPQERDTYRSGRLHPLVDGDGRAHVCFAMNTASAAIALVI
jgi:hypothetical protein